jgi:hypothetical protein
MSRSAASLVPAAPAAAVPIAQAPLPASARTLDGPGPAISPQSIVPLGDSVEGRLLAGRAELAGLSGSYVPPRPAGWHWTAVAG